MRKPLFIPRRSHQFLGDLVTPAGNSALLQIATAIAKEEGFFQSGSAPNRYHNPGDLTPGDEWGQGTNGAVTLSTGARIIFFSSDSDGWSALIAKLQNIQNGSSHVYSPDMSWAQIGNIWADGDANWGRNVAAYLGVSPSSTFADYVSNLPSPMPSPQIITPDGTVLEDASAPAPAVGVNSGQQSALPWVAGLFAGFLALRFFST